MAKFTVEVLGESRAYYYTIVTVEANDEDEARQLAYNLVEDDECIDWQHNDESKIDVIGTGYVEEGM